MVFIKTFNGINNDTTETTEDNTEKKQCQSDITGCLNLNTYNQFRK